MRLSVASIWFALLQLQVIVSAELPLSSRQLRPRDYQTRDYYALELSEEAYPDIVARHFGLEHEGPIGELANHHLFSISTGGRDIIKDRIEEYRKRRKRDNNLDELYGSILFAEKQRLKKLEKRGIPLPHRQKPEKEGFETLNYLMDTLNIRDPIFHEQWHLVGLSMIQVCPDTDIVVVQSCANRTRC